MGSRILWTMRHHGLRIIRAMPLSLTATQLIVSKICHDLAGPIGAIGAGVEAMTEQPGDAGALSLIEETQRSLVARLDMFRIAFGRGGRRSWAI